MAAPARTYYCGPKGYVRRLDNFTFPWVTVSVPNQNINLKDIKTDPTNNQKVFAVGDFNTIYVSSDAGATWILANAGTIAYPSAVWYEVWPIDPLNIVIVGSLGLVAFSTDGGITFNPAASLFNSAGSVRAVHFITPLIGVVGYEAEVFRTVDGGASWIPCNSGLPLASTVPAVVAKINGIHISGDGLTIIVHGNTNIWRSTDAGLTFVPVYTYVHTIFANNQNIFICNGKHLTWFNDQDLWGVGDYNEIVRTIDGGASWLLAKTQYPTFSIDEAAHFYTTKDGFYSIGSQLFSTNDADLNLIGTYSDTTPSSEQPIAAVWTGPPPGCFNLLACGGRPVPILVDNDLTQYLGQVIQIDGQCYNVQQAQSCQGAITITSPITVFEDCCSCNPPKYYQLEDCTTQTPMILTNTDLSQYVGQTIKVCDFQSTLTVLTPIPTIVGCQGGFTLGYVTQITGSTSGFFYEDSSGLIKPYSNPSAFPLVIGSAVCFLVNPGPTYVVITAGADPVRTIQFFLGTTPITSPIPFDTDMSIGFLQYLITLNSLDPTITLTVISFTGSGLVVQISTTNPITDTETSAVLNPPYTNTAAFTAPVTGTCICYTVTNPGTTCTVYPPFTGVVSGTFPDCVCCLPQPPPVPDPPYIPTPPEIDKHTYRIPESECDIDVNRSFASATYDKFKVDQYGINPCCNINYDKAWIQKQLSDLSKIKC